MIWKKDKLRPLQPYFELDTKNYTQKLYGRQGISHFYTFNAGNGCSLHVVPDGCVDLVFEYRDGTMNATAWGSVLEYSVLEDTLSGEIFGVRLHPGFCPYGLKVSMRDLVNEKVHLDDCTVYAGSRLLERLSEAKNFGQRVNVFLEEYSLLEKQYEKVIGRHYLMEQIRNYIYDFDGKLGISEIADKCGYTVRYVNKVFMSEMGFSPKTFSKIIQFQRAMEFLDFGAPDKMTDAAVELGYYDQPQFIRDFKKYSGMTPKKYLDKVVKKRGKTCVITAIPYCEMKA